MKNELHARPVYFSAKERIMAHFLTCFLSLLIFRILEKKPGKTYSYYEIPDTLRTMNVREEQTRDYTPAFTKTELMDDLFETFGFDLGMEVTTNLQMKEILKESKRRSHVTQILAKYKTSNTPVSQAQTRFFFKKVSKSRL